MDSKYISTIVFMYAKTTELPEEEDNQTKLTEISMIAVKSSEIVSTKKGKTPRVQQKLTLCLNPNRLFRTVSFMDGYDQTYKVRKDEKHFDVEVAHALISFLKALQKPACLVFDTGVDLPVLRSHLNELILDFPGDLFYTDPMNAIVSFVTCSCKKFSVVCKKILGKNIHLTCAEDGCVTLLKCAVVLGPQFMLWVNHHTALS